MTQVKEVQTENKMGVMPEGRLLFTMALPLIASMLVQALYNVVDSIYVSGVSESAQAALALAFPVQNLQIGFATGVAVGVNALLSRALGEKDQEKANRVAGNGIFLCGIVTVLFMLFGAFGSRAFFALQSDVQETVDGGSAYVAICCLFSVGIFVEVLFERMLQASGRTIYTMFTQGAGAIVNILLDPVFIFGKFGIPAMGVAGAAVATVIGQWIAAGLAVFFNHKCNRDVQLKRSHLRPDGELLKPILSIGVPSVIMMAIGSVMTLGMNNILQNSASGETATSVFGVYFKLQSFVFMPVFGLNNAAISIIAYNYGRRSPKRILKTLRLSSIAAFCIMTVGLLAFQLFPELLLTPFKTSDEFMRIGVKALRTISWCFPLAAIGIALGASFQSLGKGIFSTIVSLCRQLIVLLPVAFLLSLTNEITSIWLAFPIAEGVSLLITLFLFWRIYKIRILPLYERELET